MLTAWYKKQMEEKAREEGRAEIQRAWMLWLEDVDAWERRKAEAERTGDAFGEPRPTPPSGERVAR